MGGWRIHGDEPGGGTIECVGERRLDPQDQGGVGGVEFDSKVNWQSDRVWEKI